MGFDELLFRENFLRDDAEPWEWMSDEKGKRSLTAGASGWYGPSKTKVDGAQYKPSDFYVIYIGFRCVFDN